MATRTGKRNRQQRQQQESQQQQSSPPTPPLHSQQHGANGAGAATTVNGDNIGNSNNGVKSVIVDESPLRLFGVAKKEINDLFQRLHVCVNRANNFYSNEDLDPEVRQNVDPNRLRHDNDSIETILSVLSRNHMKVAFFGQVSNGKSTVINAILHDNTVLPSGCGVTTKCFLQIQGTQDDEAYVVVKKKDKPEEKKTISFVDEMANALNENSLECSTLLKIFWPVSKCTLLKYDVVFVDSPGVSADEDLDQWIDDYCHDADVFVLVSNAESTLSLAETNFFHKVSEKLSKPNIFILYNRFDRANPRCVDQVRKQHVDKAIDFLSQDLKVSSKDEARQRTFFVSAKETLKARSPDAAVRDSKAKKEGYKERIEEFQNFERKLEESLSQSALKTKFKKHFDKGLTTINDLTSVLENTRSLVSDVSKRKSTKLKYFQDRKKFIEAEFYANDLGFQKNIFEAKKKIQIVSDLEFDNEIRRLSRAFDDFDLEFSTHPAKLECYKKQLYLHVENYLSENLRTRIHGVIKKHIEPINKNLDLSTKLLSDERRQHFIASQSHKIYIQDDLFDLKIYKQFYTEFQEDLEFRFSLGLVSIIRKFQSKFSPSKPVNTSTSNLSADTDVISIFERFIINPPQSPTTVGSLAVGGILVRTVGWKVIVITTVVYGALYAYEYLTWTNSAKERAFKAQYVRYARKGLSDCVPIISQHIANSVEQKMTATYSKLKEQVDVESTEVSDKISLLESSLKKLKLCDDLASELLGDNNVLFNEFAAFAASFLS